MRDQGDPSDDPTEPAVAELFSQPAWRRWTAASLLSRLPVSMALLAFVLAGQQSLESAAQGSVLAGLIGFVAGLLGPWAGRRLDRTEVRAALQRRLVVAGLMMGVVAALVHQRAGFLSLIVAVVIMSAALAGMMAGFRSLLLVVVQTSVRGHSHYVESMMVEFGYAVGPLIVTGIYLATNIEVVLSSMSAIFLVAAILLRKIPEMFVEQVVHTDPGFAVSRTTLRVAALGFAVSTGFGIVEGSVALRMSSIGLPTSSSGPFLLLLGVGSCIGGMYVSLRPMRTSRRRLRAGQLLIAFAVTLQPYAWASTTLGLGASLIVASIPLVPLNRLLSSLIEAEAGPNNRSTLFAVFLTAIMVGGGVGVALGGVLSSTLAPTGPALISSTLYAAMGSIILIQAVFRRAIGPTL